jgi:transcriptional regulator with XRE-family HTH domain
MIISLAFWRKIFYFLYSELSPHVRHDGQRQILGISQAKLAEKVNISTHYIGMIESEKKFSTPEMLKRIAAALEIDAPALFSLKSYPASESGTIVKFQEQVLNDIAQVIAYRIKELNTRLK